MKNLMDFELVIDCIRNCEDPIWDRSKSLVKFNWKIKNLLLQQMVSCLDMGALSLIEHDF